MNFGEVHFNNASATQIVNSSFVTILTKLSNGQIVPAFFENVIFITTTMGFGTGNILKYNDAYVLYGHLYGDILTHFLWGIIINDSTISIVKSKTYESN